MSITTIRHLIKPTFKHIHDGVKHSYEYCDFKAYQKSNLQIHVKSVHYGIKHSCKFCHYKATRKSSLRTHMKSVHDGVKYTM